MEIFMLYRSNLLSMRELLWPNSSMKRFGKSNRSYKKEIPSLIVSEGMTKELFGSVRD
jgi:hypothetical protein